MILLGCALNLSAPWLRLVGASVVLNVCALFVSWTQCPYLDLDDPRSWWRVAPTGVALLSLAGVPLTLGFPARAALYARLLTEGRWLVLPLLIVAEASVLGALLRVLLDVECVLVDDEPRSTSPTSRGDVFETLAARDRVRCGGGVGAGDSGVGDCARSVGGAGSWFWPAQLPTWAALLLPLVGAVLLYRDQERIAAWMETWASVVERLLDLRWLFQGFEQVARTLGAIVWNGSLVVEGAGYMAWVTLVGLVVLLLVLA